MKILIDATTKTTVPAIQYASKIYDTIRCWGGNAYLTPAVANALNKPSDSIIPLQYAKEMRVDMVIVAGGDGSILRAVQEMGANQVPVMGINLGNVGFLTSYEPGDVYDFKYPLTETPPAAERMRLRVLPGTRELTALNEIALTSPRNRSICEYSLYIDSELATQFRGDGVIIATPTGSTAYALSAGGPLVDPTLDAMVIVPIAPYLLSSRPMVISAGHTIEIVLSDGEYAYLAVDGVTSKEVIRKNALSLRITKSPEPARIVQGFHSFFQKVNIKLRGKRI